MFTKRDMLSERAAVNGIDLGEYFAYPENIQKKVIECYESGCTREQVSSVFETERDNDGIIKGLKRIEGKPDVSVFIERLLTERVKDLSADGRRFFRTWDALLTDHAHTWQTEKKAYHLDDIQSDLDRKDHLSLNRMSLYYMAADDILSHPEDSFREQFEHISDIFQCGDDTPDFSQAEAICCYMASSSGSFEKILKTCGDFLKELGFGVDETYACLLDCASYMVCRAKGVGEGIRFLQEKAPVGRFHTEEFGKIKKDFTAELMERTVPVMNTVTDALRRDGQNAVKNLSEAGSDKNVLIITESLKTKEDEEELSGLVRLNRQMEEDLSVLVSMTCPRYIR